MFLRARLFALRSEPFGVSGAARKTALPRCKLQGVLAVQLRLANQLFHSLADALRGFRLPRRLRLRGPDDEGDLAARRPLSRLLDELRKRAAKEFFVNFRDFPREACRTVAENRA